MRIFNLIFLVAVVLVAGCDASDTGASSYGKESKGVKVEKLNINVDTMSSLEKFKEKKKFLENPEALYPGAPDEATRLEVEAIINNLASRLIAGLVDNPTKQYVLGEFEVTLSQLDPYDSEEADRALLYI